MIEKEDEGGDVHPGRWITGHNLFSCENIFDNRSPAGFCLSASWRDNAEESRFCHIQVSQCGIFLKEPVCQTVNAVITLQKMKNRTICSCKQSIVPGAIRAFCPSGRCSLMLRLFPPPTNVTNANQFVFFFALFRCWLTPTWAARCPASGLFRRTRSRPSTPHW